MPVPYPTLGINATQNVYELFKFSNNGVGGIFMPLILLSLWLIAMIGAISGGRKSSRSFVFASFITSVLSIIASIVGLLNPNYMYFVFLVLAGSLVWYKLDNAPGI